jgi:hypothetical protein
MRVTGTRRKEPRRRRNSPAHFRTEDSNGAVAVPSRVPHPYEKFAGRIPVLPYWVALPAIGMIVLVGGEATIAALGDRDFQLTQAIFALGLGVGPALLIFLSHAFSSTLGGEGTDSLASVLWPSGDAHDSDHARQAFGDWLSKRQGHIFGLQTPRAKAIVVGIEAGGIATLIWSGPPFHSPLLNVGCVVLFSALLWFCGQAAFTFAQLLRLLTDIGSREVYVPFSRLPHPALSGLQRYYSGLALLTVLGYIALVAAVWDGPYGLSVQMIGWLTVLAFFPVAMTTWSFLQIHALLRRAKQHHLDQANGLVIATLGSAQGSGQALDLEAVQKALAVQESIQRLPEWPVTLSSTLAFAAALATGTAQAAIALAAWVKR